MVATGHGGVGVDFYAPVKEIVGWEAIKKG